MTDDSSGETQLMRASDNSYYIMSTLFGEPSRFDYELQARNRQAWNKWVAGELTEDDRADLRRLTDSSGRRRFGEDELFPWSEAELAEIRQRFVDTCARRGAGHADLPTHDRGYDFSHTGYTGNFSVEGFIFPATAFFSDARFHDRATFAGAFFKCEMSIMDSVFEADCDLADVVSGLRSLAVRTIFRGRAIFTRCKLADGMQFHSARFEDQAEFDGADLKQSVDFSGAVFLDHARFDKARVEGSARFSGAVFHKTASFTDADFDNSEHGGAVDFRQTRFDGEADFAQAKFSARSPADFTDAAFGQTASFVNSRWRGRPNFRRARFIRHPPDFVGAMFGNGMSAPHPGFGIELAQTRWPDAPPIPAPAPDDASEEDKGRIAWETGQAKRQAAADIASYQHLKFLAGEQDKPGEALDFHARQLRAQRIVDGFSGRPWQARTSALFELVSDYGRSILRPLIAMAVLFVPTAIIFEQSQRLGEGCAPLTPVQAWGTSLATLFSVLPGVKDMVGYPCLSPLATVTAGFNALAGAVLLFLVALALRNRFRMR